MNPSSSSWFSFINQPSSYFLIKIHGVLCSFLFWNICFFPLSLFSAFIDLEEEIKSPSILEIKKIEIPGFPNAFNPSLIPFKDTLLMSFRTGDYFMASDAEEDSLLMSFRFHDPLNGSTNEIGLVVLDKDFNVISEPQLLMIPRLKPHLAFRQQDPRLIKVGNRVYIAYSNILENVAPQEIRRMFIVELFFDGKNFTAGVPECISRFEGENQQRWQKNWVPFEYEGKLMLSYSIQPHRVLFPFLDGSEEAFTVASSSGNIVWDWGQLRGGTQALLDGDHYLSFFHSTKEMKTQQSKGAKISHYFMGAYTFEKNPPFSVTSISPQPLVTPGFYSGPLHQTWKPIRVVFPGGLIFDDTYIWVAYGRQDHEIWITKLDKKELYKSLVPVTTQN